MKMMRYLVGLLAIALMIAAPAFAHDSWIEISPALIEKGQPVSVQMMLGNHSNQHRSFRIAGKWAPQYTKLSVIDPKGNESEITSQLVDLGEDEEKVPPKGIKGFYMAPFTPKEEGLHLVLAKEERILQHGDGPKFRSIKLAKNAFGAFSAPTVSAARNLKGFDRASGVEQSLEIIPLTNPLGVYAGGSITLEIRHKGKPASGKVVSLLQRMEGAASVVDLTTNDRGRVTFNVPKPDLYLTRVKLDEDGEKIEGQYEKSTYEATFVFPVFNRP